MLQKRIDDQPSISREMVQEAQEILHRHLKRVGLKQTAQRDTILRSFLETRDHLSTDELHRLVQKEDSGIGYTTVEIKVNYVRAMTDKTGPVRVEGKVINVGSRIATSEGKLYDAAGKLLAHGTTTCLIFPM